MQETGTKIQTCNHLKGTYVADINFAGNFSNKPILQS